MERYEAYKDSGVEWIGEIPVDWGVKAFKRFALICNGREHKNVWTINGDYPIMGSGGEFGRSNEYMYNKPSVILGRKGTIDKPRYIDEAFWAVDTAYYTVILDNTDNRYFYYLCLTINFDLYVYGSAVPSMTQATLSQIPFCSPPKPEQTAIANFLDCKTAEINALIAQKECLLELYEEEKTAIINHAVTKGLDPDVELKDSEVEWLGEIPDGWEIKKLARIVEKLTNGYVGPTREIMRDSGVPYVQGIHIKNNSIKFTPSGNYYVEKDWSINHSKSILKTDDLLVVQTGSIGDIGIVEEEFDGANCHALLIVRVNKDHILPKYLLYYLSSPIGFALLQKIKTGEILFHINGSKLKGIDITLPPLNEQAAIVQYIESEAARIDAKIAKTQRIIELQKEYRTALISEVVTGKIKVPQLPIQEASA